MPLQLRRGTEEVRIAELVSKGIALAPGEPLFVTDDQRLYIGDGQTPGGVLVTGFNSEDAVDAVGAALVAGNAINPNVKFIYGLTQDSNNRIEAVLDLENYNGEIGASGFRGSILATDSSTIIDSVTASVNLDGTIKGNLIPFTDSLHDIGSSFNKFRKLHLSDEGISIGMANIIGKGLTIDIPYGSTLSGLPIAVEPGPGTNYFVNIVGEDSSVIVDAENAIFNGTLVGDVQGSVFGDDSTIMVDAVDRKIFGNNGLYGDLKNFSDDTIIRAIDKFAFLGSIRFGSINATGAGVIEAQSITAFIDNNITFISDGTPSPVEPIFSVLSASNAVEGDTIALARQRGSALFPDPVQNNDEIGNFGFAGFDGVGYKFAGGITGIVDGSVFQDIVPTRMELKVNNSLGIETTVATVKSTKFEMNGIPFKLAVYANDSARDTGIPLPEAGMVIFMISGTSPAATNRAQVNTDGTTGGWVNLG